MGWLSWILFGALAGWAASVVTGRNSRMGCLANVIIGVLGAFIGGFLYTLLTGKGISIGFNWLSFLVAVIGATLLLMITGLFSRRR
ncbi:MAG TPA: GlsB/YeaQ/YmgE family stress response membrane protein [Longilinea sp.]|nr:GlsB/YeaQ/YmgE family stress response membrane protein [Longilinea sp.]